jgi:hypothetical protein
LAPQGLSPFLEVEDSTWQAGAAGGSEGNSRTDSHDEPRKSALGALPGHYGELLQLGIEIGETNVSKYMVRRTRPPSQTWKTFLENRVKSVVSVDFFAVPDDPVPDPVGVSGAGARVPVGRTFRGDGPSDCGVDCSTTAGSLSLG